MQSLHDLGELMQVNNCQLQKHTLSQFCTVYPWLPWLSEINYFKIHHDPEHERLVLTISFNNSEQWVFLTHEAMKTKKNIIITDS